jgi:transketolase
MRAIPNMTVVVPADGVETAKLVFAAAKHQGPVYARLGRSAVPILFDDDYEIEIGKAVKLREGSDVSLFACGILVSAALEAAQILQEEGISAEVLNVHTLKPLDVEAVSESARKTGAVVTAEEHSIIGGLGSAVAEALAENCPVPMKRIGLRDRFGESGKPAELLKKYGMTAADIAAAAKETIARKSS